MHFLEPETTDNNNIETNHTYYIEYFLINSFFQPPQVLIVYS